MVGINHSSDIVIQAFEYLAILWSLYNRLRHNFLLLLLESLRKVTSKVSKLDENIFRSVFNTFNASQKESMILHDGVYIKKILLYYGKYLFGKSVDNPSILSLTVLGIMSICLK